MKEIRKMTVKITITPCDGKDGPHEFVGPTLAIAIARCLEDISGLDPMDDEVFDLLSTIEVAAHSPKRSATFQDASSEPSYVIQVKGV